MSEREIIRMLQEGGLQFPPFCLSVLNTEQSVLSDKRIDVFIRMEWQGRSHDFAIECKALSTPQAFRDVISQIQFYIRAIGPSLHQEAGRSAAKKRIYPMIVVPYLSEDQLRQLESMGISGLDLCGNGVIVVPGEWLVFRTGFPNKFPHNTPIKNIYTGVTSLVARAFLLQPKYTSVSSIKQEIERRGRFFALIINHLKRNDEELDEEEINRNGIKIVLSTVSKSLNNLEEDLIVERDKSEIRLIQPEKLLEKLVENYKPPKITRRFMGKLPENKVPALTTLIENAEINKPAPILTGSDSTSSSFYSVAARGDTLSLYCTSIDRTLANTSIEEIQYFPDVELLETEEPTVYFDRRIYSFSKSYMSGYWGIVASPIQTYLELMQGDARDKQTAKQVRLYILTELEKQNQ